jgi:hypothetical protein
MGSASWPASVASRAREGYYYSLRSDTTGVPIISIAERGKGVSLEPARGPECRSGVGLTHALWSSEGITTVRSISAKSAN